MALNIGDAVLTFFGNTEPLDQVFARLPAQTEAAMGAAAGSVAGLGDAVGGVNFELDATAQNVPYCGEVFKEAMDTVTETTHHAAGEVGLIGELIGIRVPKHVRSFIAELPGIGTALEAAFAATAVIFIIEAIAKGIEKLEEWREFAHKSELAWDGFNTSVIGSMNGLNDKLLEAGIHVDNLRGDHISALRKEVELLDHQSLRDLVSEFDVLSKASDVMFAQFKAGWLGLEAGSTGAKNAMDDFKAKYDLLLAEGKKDEATGLLEGTLKRAKEVLALQEEAKKIQDQTSTGKFAGDAQRAQEVMVALQKESFGFSEKEIEAQKVLVGALQAQVKAQQVVSDTKKYREEGKDIEEHNRAIAEQERYLQVQNKQEQAAIAAEDKLREDARNKAIAGLQEQEKEKIAAVRQGSEAQLQAIEAAIKEEESKGLQDTAFYKSLQEQKVRFHANALAAQEKSENLAAANAIASAANSAKVETAAITEAYSQQEHAVTTLGNFKILSARDVSKRLELLYAEENAKLLAILSQLLKKEEDAVKSAQTKLKQKEGNPLVSPQEIDELKKVLSQAEKAVTDTQVKISTTTKQFQDKQLSLDKGYYGQSLALAIASGQKEAAEKLRSTHAALLIAQAESVEAKARGVNTDAIDKEIKALQKVEKEQEKIIKGNATTGDSAKRMGEVSDIAFRGMAEAFATATNAMITHQVSFGKALVAATLEMLAEIAKHYANIYIAKGIGNLADMNWSAAALDFAAAAAFEVVAGVLTGEASNISSGSGKTGAAGGSNQANTDTSKGANKPAPQPTSSTNIPHLYTGAIVTQPTLAMVGDNGSGGRSTEGIFRLDDPRAVQAARRLLGSGGESSVTNHINIKGMLSTQDMVRTMRQINRGSQTGRLRVSVSSAGRVIKKG